MKLSAKKGIFNVKDYGASADGVTLDTCAVQAAVEAAYENGGGRVVFSEGTYVLSTVFLRSGVEIYIPAETTVLGSLNFNDYAPDEKVNYPLYQDASHSFFDCSMFVAKDCRDIAVCGEGVVDMRSVWDEENVRNMVCRGAKCIAFKNCENVRINGLTILNVTDLAVYFAGCVGVDVFDLKMRVYIDGISPDNSKNVRIENCDVECGDDGIVFKSSYTLNKLDVCENIEVRNCRVKSRCNAIKFGTETNGGFMNILIENIEVRETRITGIAIESVDGAVIDGVTIRGVTMVNVGSPIFVHLGKRLRAPEGTQIGAIRNVTLENITAEGPYEPYECIEWNHASFVVGDRLQYPWRFGFPSTANFTAEDDWQITSNVCGLNGYPLENITLRNVSLKLDGGVKEYERTVREEPMEYPEVFTYGRILPASGIFFRHIDGLTLDNVKIDTYRKDAREPFVFENVNGLRIL